MVGYGKPGPARKPNRSVKARDLCATCYDRLWRQGKLTEPPSAPNLIRRALEADGGWLTFHGVTAMLPELSEATVHRTLFRLRQEGAVESRHRWPGPTAPNEWRTV